MNKTVVAIVSLIFGGVIGGLVGYKVTKKKYEKLADREVESVSKALKEFYETPKQDLEKPEVKVEKIKKPVKLGPDNEYIDYTKPYKSTNDKPKVKVEEIKKTANIQISDNKAYFISTDEWAESNAELQTIILYSDNILADDSNNLLKNYKNYLGDNNIIEIIRRKMINEVVDCVYIRNERLGIDYEIMSDERRYRDVAPAQYVQQTDTDYDDEEGLD